MPLLLESDAGLPSDMSLPPQIPPGSAEEVQFIEEFVKEKALPQAKFRNPDREPTEDDIARAADEIRQLLGFDVVSLEHAKILGAHLYMEGDWGGQIYLSIPARQVECDQATLNKLLAEIDFREWNCNDGDGGGIAYERQPRKENGIGGGMGGGEIEDGLWVHRTLEDIKPLIQAVLSGKLASIGVL